MSLRQESRFPWFQARGLGVVAIAVAIVWSTSIVVSGWKAIHLGEPIATETSTPGPAPAAIEVQGSAERHFRPQHETWTITVHGRDTDRAGSIAKLRDNVRTVRTFLLAHELRASEIAVDPASVDRDTLVTDTSDTSQTDSDLDATQVITITTDDVARGLRAYAEATTADDLDDADLTQPGCTVDHIDAIDQQLLAEARTDAHAKARAAVSQYGGAGVSRLANAAIGTANATSDCNDIVVTATANATYQLD
jgi:hypothetical protein